MNYPFELPEARSINDFMAARPNIAGFQSFHNSGGMILRGPGAAWQGRYPQSDIRVYDELGEFGERMLPYYDYLVIWQGLYTVHGGSIDWTNDGLGIVSFSNELWNGGQYFNSPLLQEQQQDPRQPISGQRSRFFFDDFLEFGDEFVDWAPFDHPQFGPVELGGWKKLSGRVNPRFMSMELFHRNMAFTLYHADMMPLMSMGETSVERVDGDVYRVRIDITNERLIPTIYRPRPREQRGAAGLDYGRRRRRDHRGRLGSGQESSRPYAAYRSGGVGPDHGAERARGPHDEDDRVSGAGSRRHDRDVLGPEGGNGQRDRGGALEGC